MNPQDELEEYFFVQENGEVVNRSNHGYFERGSPFDEEIIAFGNCFQTKEQAEEAARRIERVLKNFQIELSLRK